MKWKLGVLGASAALWMACGGSDLECGAGTVDEDGQCVPEAEGGQLECGTGTMLMGSTCVPAGGVVTCAEGTTETNGVCVPDVACGPNTMPDASGNCVPSTQITCGEGTLEMNGACVPDLDNLCAPGTTPSEGQCLTDEDVLLADADVTESTEENDLLFDGTPEALTLPDVGDSLIVRGGFDAPIDRSGDGVPEQDVDTYAFTGSAGTILRIQILDAGAGTTAFAVMQEDSGYMRLSPGFQANPERELVLTADGEFTISVSKNLFFNRPTVGPEGGDGFDYVMTIEALGTPDLATATALDATTGAEAPGVFMDLSDNLFQVQAGANDYVRTGISDVGPGVDPVFVMLDGSGAVLGELSPAEAGGFVRRLPVENDLAVLVDYVSLEGRFNDFTISASLEAPEVSTETLNAGETITLIADEDDVTFDPLTGGTWAFDAVVNERSVLFFDYSNNGSLDLRLYGEGGALERELDFSSSPRPLAAMVVLNSGTFSAEYFNKSETRFGGVTSLDASLSP
ncbi:MAG: EB domain-containing protein, partial [Myxococcota bacterium]